MTVSQVTNLVAVASLKLFGYTDAVIDIILDLVAVASLKLFGYTRRRGGKRSALLRLLL